MAVKKVRENIKERAERYVEIVSEIPDLAATDRLVSAEMEALVSPEDPRTRTWMLAAAVVKLEGDNVATRFFYPEDQSQSRLKATSDINRSLSQTSYLKLKRRLKVMLQELGIV